MLEKLFLITYFSLLISINGKVIIPFKYISEKTQSVQTPKEIMNKAILTYIKLKSSVGTNVKIIN